MAVLFFNPPHLIMRLCSWPQRLHSRGFPFSVLQVFKQFDEIVTYIRIA